MAETTFRSPGFFEQEIDLSQEKSSPVGTPAGVIGTAEKGPAFVPVTIGSFADFETRFGSLNPDRFGPYAVKSYFDQRTNDTGQGAAVTYTRVLGAGANATSADITNTQIFGVTKNAGFKVLSSSAGAGKDYSDTNPTARGAVQFLVATHHVSASEEGVGYPQFSDNSSFPDLATRGSAANNYGNANDVSLVRGVLLNSTGSRCLVASYNQHINGSWLRGTETGKLLATQLYGTTTSIKNNPQFQTFKLVLSSSSGQSFGNDDSVPGLRIYTASLNPASPHYISKVLNTSPDLFQETEHLLYLDYAVEDELAPVSHNANAIAILSGSGITNNVGLGDNWMNSFGRYDSRYTSPRTPDFISQPYGTQEYNLFHVESLSDGAYANTQLKISISNLVASTNPNNKFGTFNLEVRKLRDSDTAKEFVEVFPNLSLNPNDERFIGKQIGDMKAKYNFDAEDPNERRVIVTGKYPNRSSNIRVVINSDVYDKVIPNDAMPFGFRGIPVLKTTDTLTDIRNGVSSYGSTITTSENHNFRLQSNSDNKSVTPVDSGMNITLTGSIVPPIPFRFKVTRGAVKQTDLQFKGDVGENESVDPRFYWGVNTTKLNVSSSYNSTGGTVPTLNPNPGTEFNPLILAYSKFNGIENVDNVVTGSGKDVFNNNKFTLARVALYNSETNFSNLTGSANEHMIQAAYFRSSDPDGTNYRINDSVGSHGQRITFASLIQSSSVKFNRFSDFAKFTTIFYGGFDGLNVLDKDSRLMRDKAASIDAGGKAGSSFTGGLGLKGTDDSTMSGAGVLNNVVSAYRKATELMTDPMMVRTHILAIPGMRDQNITNYALRLNKDYSMSFYIMDMQHYNEGETRLFDDSTSYSDPRETAEQFLSRGVDNNYAGTYYPDVYIEDTVNNRNVKVPSSVVALGALGNNDKVGYPWFAPAGFSRGSLTSVRNIEVRLNTADRDTLYDARINPIANFSGGQHVIFGQKTLQQAKTALDRVNVRRMLLEVKRLIIQIADKFLFEPNTAATRNKFAAQIAPILALVQAQEGIEKFSVICDSTNNSAEDVEGNKMNGRIVIVPTRTIEFIAIDFIITKSGVEFA